MESITSFYYQDLHYLYSSLFIPISLLQFSTTKNILAELQLYILLKFICFGQIKLTAHNIYKLSEIISTSTRTVRRRLKKLISMNWVGYDKKSRFYFVRGFRKICEIERLKGSYCAEFIPKWIKDFISFAAGAVIGFLVKKQIWRDRRLDLTSGRSEHCPAAFKPVATKALSKILNISYSKAYRLKQAALSTDMFLEKDDPRKHAKCMNIPASQLPEFLRVFPYLAGKVYFYQNKIWLKSIDHFRTDINFRRKRFKIAI